MLFRSVANAAIAEAAQRMEELDQLVDSQQQTNGALIKKCREFEQENERLIKYFEDMEQQGGKSDG